MAITTTTAATCNFHFTPVRVSRGRKFRGFAYHLGGLNRYQVAWNVWAESTKLWDPATKQVVTANPDFCEDVPQDEATTLEAKAEYIRSTIQGTIDWCRTKVSDEAEAQKFARNVLRKHHPEMMAAIDEVAPDRRDVMAEIAKTLVWAEGLKTRACTMYGRYCPGGKDIPVSRKVRSAYHALQNKGVDKLPGFQEAWVKACTAKCWSPIVEG